MKKTSQIIFNYAKNLVTQHTEPFRPFKNLYILVFGSVKKMQVYLIKGSIKNTDCFMTTLFVGSEHSAHQFASLVYSQIKTIFPAGKFLPCHIEPFIITRSLAEITAFRIERPFANKFLRQNYLLLPNVSFILDLRRPIDEIIKRMSRRRRRDLKKIEALNYSYVISRDNDESFNFFYWKIYLPFTRKRFGKAAYVKTYLESKIIYKRNGGIVFVRKGDDLLAGILFQIQGKKLSAWSLGIYEGNQQLVKDLVGEAALLSLIKWSKMEGLETLDYGSTLPFLQEGHFVYKKEWGMIVEELADQSVCALRVNSISEGSLSFLHQNPFIFTEKGRIRGAIFLDHSPTEMELQQILSDHFLPYLDSLVVIAYYHNDSKIVERTPFDTTPEDFSGSLTKPLLNICSLLRKHGFKVKVSELKG